MNFQDALQAGYQSQLLMGGETLLGYFVAMKGVDEGAPAQHHRLRLPQRQGWARVMLDALAIWSRGQGAQWLWLEVRLSNLRAMVHLRDPRLPARGPSPPTTRPKAAGARTRW